MRDARLRGLYAVTPDACPDLGARVAAALRGGARLVQYRSKSSDARDRAGEACRLLALCNDAGALLIVNDDVELARMVGAHGVHLGKDDPAVADARVQLGPHAIIGASCYASMENARRARADGADYLAFGSFHPSPTKPAAVRASRALLEKARTELDAPLCAIGGITPDNGAELVAAGADMLAVISGLFAAPDVETAARRYAALWSDRNG